VSWAWYAGAWNLAWEGVRTRSERMAINNGAGAPYFVTHHQPFNYSSAAPGTRREEHFGLHRSRRGIDKGELPAVAFYKPQGTLNQHPGSYADILSGDQHVADLVARIRKSPLWASTVIIVTYDENGGFWEHVAPPKGDRWGPGTRIPAIIISPFAKRGVVDHTSYDTTSNLKFITVRFGLEPLPGVRAGAGDLTAAFAP
jgi:acid phosphatase